MQERFAQQVAVRRVPEIVHLPACTFIGEKSEHVKRYRYRHFFHGVRFVAVLNVRLYELRSRHKSCNARVTPGQKLFPVFFPVNRFLQSIPDWPRRQNARSKRDDAASNRRRWRKRNLVWMPIRLSSQSTITRRRHDSIVGEGAQLQQTCGLQAIALSARRSHIRDIRDTATMRTRHSIHAAGQSSTARADLEPHRPTGAVAPKKNFLPGVKNMWSNAVIAQNCATFSNPQTHRAHRVAMRAKEIPEDFFARRAVLRADVRVSALRFRSARRTHPDREVLRIPRRGCSASRRRSSLHRTHLR